MNALAATARRNRAKPAHVGDHLREWRQRRHLSQLDLAGDAEVSARHLSFVETGRATPSRDMVLKLAERLDVPLRERNVLLVAAGYAPAFPQRSLDDPALKSARAAINLVLRAHEPNPALAYDRHWNLVSANRMLAPILEGVPQRLLAPPLNILRLAFHPEGLAPRTVNLAEWAAHLLDRLHRQCEATADPELIKLYNDLKSYPLPARSGPVSPDNVAIPFKLRHNGDVLSFISTTMVFGTPVDITLSELALVPDVPVEVHWRPFFLNSWVPREGISRDEYLTAKFGSVEAYKGIAGRVVAAAGEEGLTYRPELVKRQPNTIDCHRLIHWAETKGKAAEMKQRLMELYFRDGGDLTDVDVLVQAAADVGLDADDVRKRLATDEDVAEISAQAQEASDKGISGVPTFVFAQKYAVSGAQPAEQLARAIREVSAEINAQAAE